MNPKATLVLQGQWEFLELFIIRQKSRVNRGGRYLAFLTTVRDKNCEGSATQICLILYVFLSYRI